MRFSLLVFIALFFPVFLRAQVSGCDGTRYKKDVFTAIKKTTISYAPTTTVLGENIQLAMDVYEPDNDAAAKRPVVVLAHGGSFYAGDRTMMERYCRLLAQKGYVAATIQYRLYPLFVLGFPDSSAIFDTAVKAIGDMKAAVRYFRMDAATDNRFRIDPDHVFAGGYSAGAVTALNTGFIDPQDSLPPFIAQLVAKNGGLEGNSGNPANKSQSSAVEAVINMSGGMYRRNWIDADDVPVASIHGTADLTVPYTKGLSANIAYLEGSSLLHARALEVGVRSTLETVTGGGHTNIYDLPLYSTQLDAFWAQATALLESLSCATTAVTDPRLAETNWHFTPNPLQSNRALTLHLPETHVAASVSFHLFDVSGKEVFLAKNMTEGQMVYMPRLPSGNYFAHLRDAQGTRFIVKTLLMP